MFYLPSHIDIYCCYSILFWITFRESSKKSGGWISFSIQLDCLNVSTIPFVCTRVSTKYTQIHTREKICVHCIPTINLNEKHISLVRFVTIFSLDGFVPFHLKYPNSKMLWEFVLAVIVVTVVSCWVNDRKRRRVIESERERERTAIAQRSIMSFHYIYAHKISK